MLILIGDKISFKRTKILMINTRTYMCMIPFAILEGLSLSCIDMRKLGERKSFWSETRLEFYWNLDTRYLNVRIFCIQHWNSLDRYESFNSKRCGSILTWLFRTRIRNIYGNCLFQIEAKLLVSWPLPVSYLNEVSK